MENTSETFTIRYRGDIIVVQVLYSEKDCYFLLRWPDGASGSITINDQGLWTGDVPVGDPSEIGPLIDAMLS